MGSFKIFPLLQEMSYRKLQRGNKTSRCDFQFEKTMQPKTIKGYYDAEQEENEDTLTHCLFDINMFSAAQLPSGK